MFACYCQLQVSEEVSHNLSGFGADSDWSVGHAAFAEADEDEEEDKEEDEENEDEEEDEDEEEEDDEEEGTEGFEEDTDDETDGVGESDADSGWETINDPDEAAELMVSNDQHQDQE